MERTHATPKGILTIAKTVPGQYALLLFLGLLLQGPLGQVVLQDAGARAGPQSS